MVENEPKRWIPVTVPCVLPMEVAWIASGSLTNLPIASVFSAPLKSLREVVNRAFGRAFVPLIAFFGLVRVLWLRRVFNVRERVSSTQIGGNGLMNSYEGRSKKFLRKMAKPASTSRGPLKRQ